MGSMKTGVFAAILAAFLAVGFVPHDVKAHSDSTTPDSSAPDDETLHWGGACDRWARIGATAATCLWENDRGWDSIHGYVYEVRNDCSDYGTLVVHNDIIAGKDHHWHLEDGTKDNYEGWADSRGIYCCLDDSDLCYKDQVEPIASGDWAGHVRVIKVKASSYEVGHVDVRTHEQRYDLCSDAIWSDQIYCEVDPEGDAHVLPASRQPDPATASMRDLRARPCGGEGEPRCTCSSHICDRFDCEWNFNQSPASNTCHNWSGGGAAGLTHDEGDMWNCGVEMRCDISVFTRRDATFSGGMWELRNLKNCGGVLQTEDCGETFTLASCETAFNASPAADSCTGLRVMSVNHDPTIGFSCQLTAVCGDTGSGIEVYSLARTRDVLNCDGRLKLVC